MKHLSLSWILGGLSLALLLGFGGNGRAQTSNLPSDKFSLLNDTNPIQPGWLVARLAPGYTHLGPAEVMALPQLTSALLEAGVVTIDARFPNAKPLPREFRPADPHVPIVDLTHILTLRLADTSRLAVAKAWHLLGQRPEFLYAEPEWVPTLLSDTTPNDAQLVNQWWVDTLMARQAWYLSQGDTNVVIGVVDTGFDMDHPDMVGNLQVNHADPIDGIDNDGNGLVDDYYGWDFMGADWQNPVPDNDPSVIGGANSHGAAVAGLSSPATNNGIGVASPAFNCRFIPIKTSADNLAILYRAYDGVVYAADRGCQVINCSWGGTSYSNLAQDIIYYAVGQGATVVAAAGNNANEDIFYPASYRYVLTTASSNNQNKWANPSCYGYQIQVMAPSAAVRGARFNNAYGQSGPGFTSFASPIASAACALVKSHFPSYTPLQVFERVRVTATDVYSVNVTSLAYKLGKGRLHLYDALSKSTPSIRVISHALRNTQGEPATVGDTALLTLDFLNYLDSTLHPVSVRLQTNLAGIQWLDSTLTLPSLDTYESYVSPSDSFRLVLAPSLGFNETLRILVHFDDGNDYQDYQWVLILVNPDFYNLDTNLIQTTLNSQGNFGFGDYPRNQQGIGLRYGHNPNWLYEGALLVAQTETNVSDVMRNFNGQRSTDFSIQQVIKPAKPGTFADEQTTARYRDLGPNRVGVGIRHQAYAWHNPLQDHFIISEYHLANDTNLVLDSLRVGLWQDWDLPPYATNRSSWDSLARMGYQYNADQTTFAGVVLLTPDSLHVNGISIPLDLPTADANRFARLREGTDFAADGPADMGLLCSTGPFELAVGDTHTVAWALVAAHTLDSLRWSAQQAHAAYRCQVLAHRPHVSFGASSYAVTEANGSGSDGCRDYQDYTLTLVLDAAPSHEAEVELRLWHPDSLGSAEIQTRLSLPNPLLTLPAGSTDPVDVTLRVWDDQAWHPTDTFLLGLRVLNFRATDLILGCTDFRVPVILTDDDAPGWADTLIASSLGVVEAYLGPWQTVRVTDAAGDRLAQVENLSAHNYGCTTFEIDRAGTGAVQFQAWGNPNAGTAKTLLITPTHNDTAGHYRITLFYTQAEVSGWETFTGLDKTKLTLFKSPGAVDNVRPWDAFANGGPNEYASNTSQQQVGTSGLAITGEFHTGFSGFGAGADGGDFGPLPLGDFPLRLVAESTSASLAWDASALPAGVSHFSIQRAADIRWGDTLRNGQWHALAEVRVLDQQTAYQYPVMPLIRDQESSPTHVFRVSAWVDGKALHSNAVEYSPHLGGNGLPWAWPNPTDGLLYVAAPSEGVLHLYDSRGVRVWTHAFAPSSVPVRLMLPDALPAGLYRIQWLGASGSHPDLPTLGIWLTR